jgi:2-(1,2-epoxy-1,2-dihydrophenyl)acetyl-CoA isomerase
MSDSSGDGCVVSYEAEGATARITLNRPNALNAFDAPMRLQLIEALQRAAADELVRAVVLTGAGRAFSSGADLKAGMKDGADTRRQLLEEYAPSVNAIVNMPKPVIAAVEGFVAGVGCAHVLASDLVVMAEDAFFLLPFANIALIPDGGLTWLLERRLGHRLAFELAADSDRVSASRCHELGLVNRIVPKGTAVSAAEQWAHRLAARPPLALAHTKRLLRECPALSLTQAQEHEADAQAECIDSADFREGVSAFLAKRTPRFVGR